MKHRSRPGRPAEGTAVGLVVSLAVLRISAAAELENPGLAVFSGETRRPAHLTLGTAIERTDNVNRVPTNETSDTIYSVVSDFEWQAREDSRATARLDGSLSYFRYTQALYKPELVGAAFGALTYDFVPEHLTWRIQDSLRQTRIDSSRAVTPDNRQNANHFMTGPRFRFNLGDPNTALILDAQYEQSDFSTSPEDSKALVGQAAVTRKIGPQSNLALSVTHRRVTYVQDLIFPDYTAEDFVLSWNAQGRKTALDVAGGYSRTEQRGTLTSSPYFRLELARTLTARSTLSLHAIHRLTGSSDAVHFGPNSTSAGPSTSEFAINPDPFTIQNVGLTYTLKSTRSQVSVDGAVQRDRYVKTTIDNRNIALIRTQAWTMLSPAWTVGVFGGYSSETFVNRNGAKSELIDYGVFAGVRLSPHIRLELSGNHDERNTNFAAAEYQENSARIALSYTWGEPGSSSGISIPRSTR